MTKYRLEPGREYDFLTPDDMNQALSNFHGSVVDAVVREELRGIKAVRFKAAVYDSAANSFTLDAGGPRPGFMWAIMSMFLSADQTTINSAFAFLTSDVSSMGIPGGQMNAATAADCIGILTITQRTNQLTFSKGQCMAFPGQHIGVVGSGNASGANIVLHGFAIEVPAEMVGKLLI